MGHVTHHVTHCEDLCPSKMPAWWREKDRCPVLCKQRASTMDEEGISDQASLRRAEGETCEPSDARAQGVPGLLTLFPGLTLSQIMLLFLSF